MLIFKQQPSGEAFDEFRVLDIFTKRFNGRI